LLKLLYKGIAVVLITTVMHAGCSSAFSSNVPETLVLDEVPVETSKEERLEPPPVIAESQVTVPKKDVKKGTRNFMQVLFDVLIALGKTAALIFTGAGVYLIYKKVKVKKTSYKKEKENTRNPKTVEQAVSSYIKHKLRK